MTLLQNQLLGIENENLLNEIHNNDENYMNKGLYTQMQAANDAAPVQITSGEWNDNCSDQGEQDKESPEKSNKSGSSPNKQNLEKILYSGAFAYTSPPERVIISDSINQSCGIGDNDAADETTTPFNTKFTVLKFNTANGKKANSSAKKLGSKRKAKLNIFKNCQEENKARKLLDFKIPEPVMGKGIFKDGTSDFLMQGSSSDMCSNNQVLKSQRTAASEGPIN